MTFTEFLALTVVYNAEFPDQRRGQSVFNVLRQQRPDLSERIRGTQLDPFYRDERLIQTLDFLAENW